MTRSPARLRLTSYSIQCARSRTRILQIQYPPMDPSADGYSSGLRVLDTRHPHVLLSRQKTPKGVLLVRDPGLESYRFSTRRWIRQLTDTHRGFESWTQDIPMSCYRDKNAKRRLLVRDPGPNLTDSVPADGSAADGYSSTSSPGHKTSPCLAIATKNAKRRFVGARSRTRTWDLVIISDAL